MFSRRQYHTSKGFTPLLNPKEFDIKSLHFGILNLPPESTFFDHSDDCEVALIVLGGQCTLLVGHNGNKANGILGKRANVFDGYACVAYIPRYTTYEVFTTTESIEIAICKTRSETDAAAVILEPGGYDTQTDYYLHISEKEYSADFVGEAACFYRFQNENGSVKLKIVDAEENTARIVLENNELLILPENTQAHKMSYEGVYYQLTVGLSTHLQ